MYQEILLEYDNLAVPGPTQ